MSIRKDNSIINRIASLVKHRPGLTGAELSQQLHHPGAYRRLSEVKKLGLVKKGSKRQCTVAGKDADTWYPDDSPTEPERGETHMQRIRRLEGRIAWLEKENNRLRDQIVNGV